MSTWLLRKCCKKAPLNRASFYFWRRTQSDGMYKSWTVLRLHSIWGIDRLLVKAYAQIPTCEANINITIFQSHFGGGNKKQGQKNCHLVRRWLVPFSVINSKKRGREMSNEKGSSNATDDRSKRSVEESSIRSTMKKVAPKRVARNVTSIRWTIEAREYALQ